MRLEDLQFEPRPRSHWEALDLGTLLARRWYPRLLVLWLLPAAPVFLLVFALLPAQPGVAMLICWWLKPVYERLPLKYLSRAVFDDAPSFGDAVREGLRAVPPGMLAVLTLRRLSPVRSFIAPLYVLEGQLGDARRRRQGVLLPRANSAALWLTVLGVHVEAFLVFALLPLVYLLVPSSVEVDWLALLLSADQGAIAWLLNLGSFAAMGLVAPYYVAGGFALYLNRRVELEAWDVELGFRRLAQRLGTVAVVLGCLVIPPLAQRAAAQEPEPPLAAADDFEPALLEAQSATGRGESRRLIGEVLLEPAFHEQSTVRYPEFLDGLRDDEPSRSPVELGWLATMLRWLAWLVEVALWVVVVLGFVWLLWRVRWLAPRGGSDPAEPGDAGARVGPLTRGVAVPDDAPAAAVELWRSGRQREALGLLYRSCLARLSSRFGLTFDQSTTELDCLARASDAPAEQRAYLEELTRAWTRLAYAHQGPDDVQFAALARRWADVLDGASPGLRAGNES